MKRLARLHHDQAGSVQSLSFVLTLPIFIMVMLLIVQVSQLMIGQIVVEYAAIAAARAAIVWIPAQAATPEGENCISWFCLDPDQSHAEGGVRYIINPGSPKYLKIQSAAVLACLPLAPSRAASTGASNQAGNITQAGGALDAAYAALDPKSSSNNLIPKRIGNKLNYSAANTWIELRFVHKDSEPPLAPWQVPEDIGEFYYNEVGWQDELHVKVNHRLALLPGPGRLLFSKAASPSGAPDQVSSHVKQSGDVYTYQLSAWASLGNEGEKSVLRYAYQP